jgi:hypothetical protein
VEKFFAVSIQPEKEVLLTLVKKEETRSIMENIVKMAGLKTEGKGLAIALPVSNVAGISVYDEHVQKEGSESK